MGRLGHRGALCGALDDRLVLGWDACDQEEFAELVSTTGDLTVDELHRVPTGVPAIKAGRLEVDLGSAHQWLGVRSEWVRKDFWRKKMI